MKAYDLTGQRFGRLIVQYKCNYKKVNKYPWHCICDCGNTHDVPTQDLITGKTQSCGCYKKEKASLLGKKTGTINGKKRAKNLTNQIFGRLTAISLTNEKAGSNNVWLCKCECGNYIKVRTQDLLNGNTSSCGCLKSKGQEVISNLVRKNNIQFVTEKVFEKCYYPNSNGKPKFDFFVDNSYIIEYDGIQHFKEISFFNIDLDTQKYRDEYKNQWCKDNDIPIIRIPYTKLKSIKITDLLLETSEYII